MFTDPNVDGLKTGYTQKAKYCLASSAKKDHMRLIAIILGATTPQARTDEMRKLLTYGFRFYQNHTLFTKGQTIENAPVLYGTRAKVPLTVAHNINLTLSRGQYQDLKIAIHTPKTLKAPIDLNQVIGHLTVSLGDKVLINEPILAKQSVTRGSLWQRIVSFGKSLTRSKTTPESS